MLKVLLLALSSASASAMVLPDLTLDRARLVEQINADPSNLWTATAGYERFRASSAKTLCGVDQDAYHQELRDQIASGAIEVVNETMRAEDLPTAFDSATNLAWSACAAVIGDIRDQSACGCCWAFGTAEAASDRMCIATNGTAAVPLSAQDMCFCGSKNGCDGGFPTSAWFRLAQEGLVTGAQNRGIGPFGNGGFCSSFSLPHCHHYGPVGSDPFPAEGGAGCPKVEGKPSPACPTACDASSKRTFAADKYKYKGKLAHFPTATSLQEAIMANGPVTTTFKVYADFENYASGIYHKTASNSLGGHAVRIVGWGVENATKYWKVANSWNPYWGEKGYFRIVRGTNECGIESGAVASTATATWSGPGIIA